MRAKTVAGREVEGVCVFYEGDTVLALGLVTFRCQVGLHREEARVFEYLVRSGRDGHARRVSVVEESRERCAEDLVPLKRSLTDGDAVAWFRESLEGAVSKACRVKGGEVKASYTVREVHSGDWPGVIQKAAREMGARTCEAEMDQETGVVTLLDEEGADAGSR